MPSDFSPAIPPLSLVADLTDRFEALFHPDRFRPDQVQPYQELAEGIRLGFAADDIPTFSLECVPVTESRHLLRFQIERRRRLLWLTLECRVDPALLMRARRMEICVIGEGERSTRLDLQLFHFPGTGERIDLLPQSRRIPLVRGEAVTRAELDLGDMLRVQPGPQSHAEIALFLDPAMPEFDLGGIHMALYGT